MRNKALRCVLLWSMVCLIALSSISCSRPAEAPKAAVPEAPSVPPAPKPEDYIVRITAAMPMYIDPAVGLNFADWGAFPNMYDSLVFPALEGGLQPQLATKWEVSPDGLKYTFHIRQGVKFHNGAELTAEDVAFSLKRFLTIGEGTSWMFMNSVKDAKALDRYTVEFTLNKPFAMFVDALVRLYVVNKDLVMQHIKKPGPYGDMGDYAKEWLLTNDAGSGPYAVKEMRPGEHLLLEWFQDYWGGEWDANAPRYVKWVGSTESVTVRTMMSRREVEISDEWQSMENIKAMDAIEGVDIAVLPNGCLYNIMLNTKRAPTDDVHFRKALAYCLDYDVITRDIYPGQRQAKGPIASFLPGYNPNVLQYKRDLDKAREELAKSKYAKAPGQYPVTLMWSADVADQEKIALLLQACAADLGIKVEVTKTPFGSMLSALQKPDTTPNAMFMILSPSLGEAGTALHLRYHSSTTGTVNQGEWLQSKEIDGIIDASLLTVDQSKRRDLYYKVQEMIVDLCPTIWLFEESERRAYQSSYISWKAADMGKAGQLACPIIGRYVYARDMRVFPEKRNQLIK